MHLIIIFLALVETAQQTNALPDDHCKYLRGNYVNSFFFGPVSSDDVSNIILSLKNKRGDTQCIPTVFYKYINPVLSPLLTHLINLSISTGVFPDTLKIAKVSPIYKEGDSRVLGNHRPISVLPDLSKVFEKLSYNRLYDYLCKNNVLFTGQFGFRRGVSVVNAIQNYLQFAYRELDRNNYIFSLFLDLRKAFDCVDHTILLSKLKFYGVRGVSHDFFRSYLSNRFQYVKIGSSSSDLAPITHGVPQGSILGPLLFLIFINDIHNSTNFFKFNLFADDSTLSVAFNKTDLPIITDVINNNLSFVYDWLTCNKITLNVNKTNYMILSYKNCIELPQPCVVGGSVVEATRCVKFLGVFIDHNLTFNKHVNHIAGKISKTHGVLFRVRDFLSTNILNLLYHSLVQPYLIYCIEAWFGTTQTNIHRLFVLQKKTIRTIYFLPYNDHTSLHFKANNMLRLDDLHRFRVCIYLFKTLNSNFDSDLLSDLFSYSQLHSYSTRAASKLVIPKFNRTKSQFHISYTGVKFWNSLPDNIVTCNSFPLFKSRLKIYLLSSI